jgi:hypothetical protein
MKISIQPSTLAFASSIGIAMAGLLLFFFQPSQTFHKNEDTSQSLDDIEPTSQSSDFVVHTKIRNDEPSLISPPKQAPPQVLLYEENVQNIVETKPPKVHPKPKTPTSDNGFFDMLQIYSANPNLIQSNEASHYSRSQKDREKRGNLKVSGLLTLPHTISPYSKSDSEVPPKSRKRRNRIAVSAPTSPEGPIRGSNNRIVAAPDLHSFMTQTLSTRNLHSRSFSFSSTAAPSSPPFFALSQNAQSSNSQVLFYPQEKRF